MFRIKIRRILKFKFLGLQDPDSLVRVGARGVEVTALPSVVAPMYEAEDGPVSEGLGLEA